MKPSRTSVAPPVPSTDSERDAVRRQLERMLGNPLFRNSKRCASLLRYVVEQTLEGHTGDLKERTLGVEVFAREPDYDTNADPIVRATAGEIRKRIAQYYHDNQHQAEIRIDLCPRSYVPEFALAEPHPPADVMVAPPAPPPSRAPSPKLSWRLALSLGTPTITALLLALIWYSPWIPKTALDRFWAPVVDSTSTVLLCIGQRQFVAPNVELSPESNAALTRAGDVRNSAWPVSLAQLYYLGSQNVALTDASTLARLTGLLNARKKDFRIFGESSTSFSDLRGGPVVLIGGLNNDWTMRLMGPLRFSFERNDQTFWIKDRQNPAQASYTLDYDTPYLNLGRDYALISRVLEPTTERMVVVAAGLTGYGTLAAGEFLTSAAYMEAAVKGAPANWEHKNIQFIIATDVIRGNSGPPHVVERYFW